MCTRVKWTPLCIRLKLPGRHREGWGQGSSLQASRDKEGMGQVAFSFIGTAIDGAWVRTSSSVSSSRKLMVPKHMATSMCKVENAHFHQLQDINLSPLLETHFYVSVLKIHHDKVKPCILLLLNRTTSNLVHSFSSWRECLPHWTRLSEATYRHMSSKICGETH